MQKNYYYVHIAEQPIKQKNYYKKTKTIPKINCHSREENVHPGDAYYCHNIFHSLNGVVVLAMIIIPALLGLVST